MERPATWILRALAKGFPACVFVSFADATPKSANALNQDWVAVTWDDAERGWSHTTKLKLSYARADVPLLWSHALSRYAELRRKESDALNPPAASLPPMVRKIQH